MVDMLVHRGPDGTGVFIHESAVGPSVFLGHRRLRIIDLSDRAAQPLPNEDNTVWLSYNGEIYNFQALRRELEAHGHTFRSNTDSEVIVHAYEEYGDACVARLDGMFAFALWDARRGRLLLARDRSGKKPLYYTVGPGKFAFASEIKAILALSRSAPGVALEHLPEYLAFGYVRAPATLYQGILQLPPASLVVVTADGVSSPRPYWSLRLAGERDRPPMSLEAAAERVRALVVAAVERRLTSEVPLGAFLSGGLDSSIIVGVVGRVLGRPVRTFTVGFEDDLSCDERRYARAVAAHFGTCHTELVARADVSVLIERLLWHHDQPYGDSSAVPTFLLSQAAREHVTVALSGDGGDEVFAGYDRFRAALLAATIPRPLGRLLQRVGQWVPSATRPRGQMSRFARFCAHADAPVERRYAGWVSIFDGEEIPALLRETAPAEGLERLCGLEERGEVSELDLLHRLLYANFVAYLPEDLHVKVDRMSMANALETRSPLLDTALVEFVGALPSSYKVRGHISKLVLRRAFDDILPAAVKTRRKQGFGVPVDAWFRGKLRGCTEDTLLAPRARVNDLIDPGAVRRLWDTHQANRAANGPKLWSLLGLEVWLRMLERGALWSPMSSNAGEFEPVERLRERA